MPVTKAEEFAWAAGMFEGEGSVRCRRKQSSYVYKGSPRRRDQCETALTMFEVNAKRGR